VIVSSTTLASIGGLLAAAFSGWTVWRDWRVDRAHQAARLHLQCRRKERDCITLVVTWATDGQSGPFDLEATLDQPATARFRDAPGTLGEASPGTLSTSKRLHVPPTGRDLQAFIPEDTVKAWLHIAAEEERPRLRLRLRVRDAASGKTLLRTRRWTTP
jgi:hypothetical protein